MDESIWHINSKQKREWERKPEAKLKRKEWREKNKKKIKKQRRDYFKKTLDYLSSLKKECYLCKWKKHRSILEFHHIKELKRKRSYRSLELYHMGIPRIKKMLLKKEFIILCPNCHKSLHKGFVH